MVKHGLNKLKRIKFFDQYGTRTGYDDYDICVNHNHHNQSAYHTTRFEFNLWKIIPRYFPKNFFTRTVVV